MSHRPREKERCPVQLWFVYECDLARLLQLGVLTRSKQLFQSGITSYHVGSIHCENLSISRSCCRLKLLQRVFKVERLRTLLALSDASCSNGRSPTLVNCHDM